MRDVISDRVGVQGWSNGGMTVLAAMAPDPPGPVHPTRATGFRAARKRFSGATSSHNPSP